MNVTKASQQTQAHYAYNYAYIESVAMADRLPQGENFSEPWLVLTGKQAIKLAINMLITNQGDRGQPGAEDDVQLFLGLTFLQTLQEEGKSFKTKLINALVSLLPQLLEGIPPAVSSGTVSRNVETAMKTLLQKSSSGKIELPITDTAMSTTAMSTETRAIVSRSINQALQKPLPGIPSNEADIEKFVTSELIKILGKDFLKAFVNRLLKELKKKSPTGSASCLEDYRQLFTYFDPPEISGTFQSDEMFAYLRVAGPNPVMIERMTTVDQRFPVTEAQYKAQMGEADSLQAAMQEGRVYLADYAVLAGALNGTYGAEPPVQKYAYAPLALFAVPVGSAELRPVAIQCGQTPDYPVITPSTGAYAWLMAKTVVQISDANFHEAVSHFARTHLLIEPFVIATRRRLAAHPLFKLLVPHFQGTLAINFAAHELLVAAKGGVNELLSPTIDHSRVLMVKGLRMRGFNADMLPRRLKERGVDDVSALPVYPYRDDALLIWAAIHDWVEAYLKLYYGSDRQIQADRTLQHWAQELVAFDGGRLQGFGDTGSGVIETLAYLIDAVTMVIFTASAQHAAVNFPQKGIMSFAPAMPTAGYQTAQAIGPNSTQQDWLNLLPPLDQAQSQLNLLHLLGSVYFTRLGEYEAGHFTDSGVMEPLKAFQARLKEIEALIDRRNCDRPSYDYLKPSLIPQSINI